MPRNYRARNIRKLLIITHIQMPKIYLVKEIIGEILKQYPMTKGELEMTEIELQYKTYKELENILELLQEENGEEIGE
jgi:hypothetical protein